MRAVSKFVGIGLVLGALGAACAQTSSADVTKRHIAVAIDEKHATVLEVVDLGKTGFGAGDQVLEEAPVVDTSNTTVGDSFTAYTVTSGKKLEEAKGLIDCSINLKAGTILFNGYVPFASLKTGYTVPVIGGTGSYAGAGGTVRMLSPKEGRTNLTFDLLIPKTNS
jgi:hypothetical protein